MRVRIWALCCIAIHSLVIPEIGLQETTTGIAQDQLAEWCQRLTLSENQVAICAILIASTALCSGNLSVFAY